MALALADRVQETSTTTGTGTLTLAGAVIGYQSFAVVGNGNTTYYAITNAAGAWEVGIGTYTSAGTLLSRTTVLSSSNGGALVSFTGTLNVFVTYPSSKAVYGNGTTLVAPSGTILPVANGGTGASTAGAALTSLGAYPASNPSGYTSNTGTVTSVAASVPAFLSVAGSPITTSGTLAISYSGTALPVANGGTGATTLTGVVYGNGTSAFTAATGAQIATAIGATAVTNATNATNTGITNDAATAVAVYPTWVTANTGNLPQKTTSAALSFVPSTGTLSATVFSGSGASLSALNASNLSTGTVPGDRGVTAGSATSSFVEYNGTTATAGQFDGGTTTPTGTTRLNYGGYFYPTFINLTGSGDTATAASHYYVENSSDGFVRPKTLANVKTEIVTTAAVNAAAATTVGTITSGAWNGTAIGTAYGGTGLTSAGTSGNVLTSNGSAWVSSAPVGTNITTKGLYENAAIIAANYTIGTGNNAVSAGPITINSGIVVTVPSGSTWVVV